MSEIDNLTNHLETKTKQKLYKLKKVVIAIE